MLWQQTWRADPDVAALADRHYSRQTIGAKQFTPPGRVLVLRTESADAGWATSAPFAEYVHRVYPGAWVDTLFRNESAHRASLLIEQAVAASRWYFGPPPSEGMITMIDTTKVRPIKRHGIAIWGWVYRQVGFQEAGYTKGGLVILQLLPADMPLPCPPVNAQFRLGDAA